MIKLRNIVTLLYFLFVIRIETISAACGCTSSCTTPQCYAFGTGTCTSSCTATGGGSCGCTSSCTPPVCDYWNFFDNTCSSTCVVKAISYRSTLLADYNSANIGDVIEIETGSVFAPTSSVSGYVIMLCQLQKRLQSNVSAL